MFGVGPSELLVIFLIALLVLGPEQLPKVARTLAKVLGEAKKASEDLRLSMVSLPEEIEKKTSPKLPVAFAERGKPDPEVVDANEEANGHG